MNCMNCEERRQDFLVAIRQRDEARSRLVEAVGLLRTLDKGDLPLAQVSTFLASPKSAVPPKEPK